LLDPALDEFPALNRDLELPEPPPEFGVLLPPFPLPRPEIAKEWVRQKAIYIRPIYPTKLDDHWKIYLLVARLRSSCIAEPDEEGGAPPGPDPAGATAASSCLDFALPPLCDLRFGGAFRFSMSVILCCSAEAEDEEDEDEDDEAAPLLVEASTKCAGC